MIPCDLGLDGIFDREHLSAAPLIPPGFLGGQVRGRPKGGLCVFKRGDPVPRTHVYVDAANLYYGCLRGTPYRWLDIAAFCHALLPRDDVRRIRYFTAHVKTRANNPGQRLRQSTYLRALATLPTVTVHYGQYLTSVVRMPLAAPQVGQPRFVEVIKSEEKGSDVNLATHLLCDGYEGAFDAAVLVTNDSDLVEPVRIVGQRLRKPVGILNPSTELLQVATFLKPIRRGVLRASQFPITLMAFHKPHGW